MNKSKNLGHDPRHINEDSAKAYWRIKVQGIFILLIGIALISAIIFMVFCLTSCQSPAPSRGSGLKVWTYDAGSEKIDVPVYYGEGLLIDTPCDTHLVITNSATHGIGEQGSLLYSGRYHFDSVRPRFEFPSVSQFLVFSDTIEEYHMNQRIIGLDDRIVLTTSTESTSPAFFPIDHWAPLNDSTILGWSSSCAAEYQVRWGKAAVRVDFFDPNKGKAYFLAFEFWCDSTNVR